MTFIVSHVIPEVLIVFSNAIMGFSQNTFTGTYYVDNRPHEVLYLTLTQTENIVSGNLIIATPNDKKQINGESLSLNGIVDGNQITLHYKKLFSDEVINGKKQDDKIILMFPSKSGSVINITLYPSTEDNYNKIINQWRNQLVETHLLKENQEKENETIITLDKELYENINEIKNTQIQSDVDNIKQSLSN